MHIQLQSSKLDVYKNKFSLICITKRNITLVWPFFLSLTFTDYHKKNSHILKHRSLACALDRTFLFFRFRCYIILIYEIFI